MPTVDLPQGTVHYRTFGPGDATGPVVVFVHGLLVNGSLWDAVAERLGSRGVRCVVPDLPLGAHPIALSADADVSPRGVARLILDLLAALELSDVTLVGNDTGGALCQFVLDTDATRIGRLVLTNCDAFEKFPPPPFGLLIQVGKRQRTLALLARTLKWRWLRDSVLGFGGLAHRLPPAMSLGWAKPLWSDPGVRRDAARFMAAVEPLDLVEVSTRMARYERPVRLVWGTDDLFFKIAIAQRLARTFPDATLVEVPGSRTFVALDAPDRLVAEILAGQPTG